MAILTIVPGPDAQAPQVQFLPPHVSIADVTAAFSTLVIPLDTPHPLDLLPGGHSRLTLPVSTEKERPTLPARIPVRRDSLRHREELLRGNPGTRRRQRWENDRLLSNPHLTPPTPADFLPAPTHTRKVVHYDIACLWDTQYRQQHAQKREADAAGRAERAEPQIPRELKAGLKKARGAVGMVKLLEERMREFIEKATAAAQAAAAAPPVVSPTHEEGWEVVEHIHGAQSEDEHEVDEDDKEVILFTPKKHKHEDPIPLAELPSALPVYHSPPTDPSAPFIRWLVHSIAEYYGLHSWSVTEPNPPVTESTIASRNTATGQVRVAYVGLHHQHEPRREKTKQKSKSKGKEKREKRESAGAEEVHKEPAQLRLPGKMPRPLWVML